MDLKIRVMTPEEREYSYTQDAEALKKSGCIGHLRVDMDSNGMGFYSTWDDHSPGLKTDKFKSEFDEVISSLRFDKDRGSMLKNRTALAEYCSRHPESTFENGDGYGFRVDTEDHAYLLRLNPEKGEYAAYIYAYDKEMLDETLLPAPELMEVLVVEPGEKPYVKAIKTGLESLQREVGGYIEATYPWKEPAAIICDEEGKINGKKLNRAVRDEDGEIMDIIAGTFLIAGLGEEDFKSLSPKLTEHFREMFETPEMFLRLNGKMVVLPLEEDKRPKSDKIPVYRESAAYARIHGELAAYQESFRANVACKNAIEKAIAENYHDNRLDEAGAKAVLDEFGSERTATVLAATVRHKDYDGRFSDRNKAWAKTHMLAPNPDATGMDRSVYFIVDKSHPGLVDLFIDQMFRLTKEARKEKDEKSSVMEKLKSKNPEEKKTPLQSAKKETEL